MYPLIYKEAKKINDAVNFDKLRDKSILITGATGLVGIFLLASLQRVRKKFNISISVWINNNLPIYLKELFTDCEIIQGDICDDSMFRNVRQYDYIIHASGYGQPTKFLVDQVKTIHINTTATARLFNMLNKDGGFLFLSSSEVYNGLNADGVTEDMIGTTNTDHVRACYIEGKRCGEAICHAYANRGTNVKIARLCLAYGPGIRLDDNRVINEFIKKALTNGHIKLNDHGEATRKYCYITDAVEMLWNMLLYGQHVTYNVGGIDHISILDLARHIAESLHTSVILPDTDVPAPGNPKNVSVSCERYASEFGHKKFVPLHEGVDITTKWIKELSICI
jgi:nucleoside-diphosphate-sugar epimerase